MNKNYINIYNNLIKLTRNKYIFSIYTNKETFSDRLTIFLFHFAFFLKTSYKKNIKKNRQEIFDYIFKD